MDELVVGPEGLLSRGLLAGDAAGYGALPRDEEQESSITETAATTAQSRSSFRLADAATPATLAYLADETLRPRRRSGGEPEVLRVGCNPFAL